MLIYNIETENIFNRLYINLVMKIRIRPQRISDATRFLEILSNPNFIYFPAKPKSIEEQMAFLRQNPKKRKEKSEFNFSIMCDGTLVGAIGVKIDCHRPYIGEVGFFIDEAYQRKGIAGKAVEHIEKFIQKNTDIKRIERLQKLFYLGVKLPGLIPFFKWLTKYPLGIVFKFLFGVSFLYRFMREVDIPAYKAVLFALRHRRSY